MPPRRVIAAGLGTRIALRTFLLCCVCSLLPTLVIGITVYTRIASEELSAAQTRLRESAKRYGLELNARLNDAEQSLLQLAERRLAGSWAGASGSSADRVTGVKMTRLPLAEAGAIDNRNHPDSALQFHRESIRVTNIAGKYAVEMLLVVSNDEQALETTSSISTAYLPAMFVTRMDSRWNCSAESG